MRLKLLTVHRKSTAFHAGMSDPSLRANARRQNPHFFIIHRENRFAYESHVEPGKNLKFWVHVSSGSSSMELEFGGCFHGGHLSLINCNCKYQLID